MFVYRRVDQKVDVDVLSSLPGSSIALAAAVSKAHSVDSEAFDAASAGPKGYQCKHG